MAVLQDPGTCRGSDGGFASSRERVARRTRVPRNARFESDALRRRLSESSSVPALELEMNPSLPDDSDLSATRELLPRARAGDRDAQGELMARYQLPLE